MISIHRLLSIGVLSSAISAATAAQAGNQLFEASWTVKAFGNECSIAASGMSPGPYCGNGAPESSVYGAFGMPQGVQCNADQPRCPFQSTPTDGSGMFAPLGGSQMQALFCAPWSNWLGLETTARPAKGETRVYTGMNGGKIPPLYRNPGFFTAGGQPKTTFCTSTSRSVLGGKGLVQAGVPVAGTWGATTTTGGAFNFAAAPANGGVRVDAGVGEFPVVYPYVYSYTYATLRNDAGVFGRGKGPGSFSLPYTATANTVARIVVKQGAAKFGGTMQMLGQLTTKLCYYRNGGCFIYYPDWHYEAIGAAAYTSGGVVTRGYRVPQPTYCFPSYCSDPSSIVTGVRFPWTTGSVTVTAVGRGPHKTVHYAKGYDNRTPTSGKGTIQMVSPVLTRWLQPAVNFETGGIAILRIKFIPEPHAWVMLIAGVSLLGLSARMRER